MNLEKKKIISKTRIKNIYNFLESIGLNLEEIEMLKKSKFNINIINEALTHTSANHQVNHENLEFLGDAVLRLVASEYIDEYHPELKVGDRSALRAQLVSDEWLATLGAKLCIKKIMIVGTKALKDKAAIETIQAEGLEAFIGALYECTKELKFIKTWLSYYWKLTSEEVLSDPYRLNSKSALQEWSQGQGLEKPKYEIEEVSKKHGDKKRFFCKVIIKEKALGEGWGSSRKNAEKEAAKMALKQVRSY